MADLATGKAQGEPMMVSSGKAANANSASKRSVFASGAQCLAAVFAASLAAFYILPGTAITRLSPLWYIPCLGHSLLGLADIAVISLVALIILGFLFVCNAAKNSWVWTMTCVYAFVVGGTSLFWYSDRLISSNCGIILTALAVGLGIAQLVPARTAVAIIIFEMTIQAAFAIYAYSHGLNHIVSGDVARAGGTFDAPHTLCFSSLIGILLCVGAVIQCTNPAIRSIIILCVAALVAALVVTWFRAGVLALAVSSLWYCRNMRVFKPEISVVALVFVILLGFVTLHMRSHNAVDEASTTRSTIGHIHMWNIGVRVFLKNWATGVGFASLQIPITTYSLTHHGYVRTDLLIEPKNVALFWLDEMGVFGGVLLAGFVVAIVLTLRKSEFFAKSGITAVWIGVAIMSLFDVPFGTVKTLTETMVMGILLGIMIRGSRDVAAIRCPQEVANQG